MARQTIREALKQLMNQSPHGAAVFRQGAIAYQVRMGASQQFIRTQSVRQGRRKG